MSGSGGSRSSRCDGGHCVSSCIALSRAATRSGASFNSIGTDELAVTKVTGGIGEALIATAAGLGIAIVTLVPLNLLSGRLSGLQADLEAAATTLQVAIQKGRAS